MVGVSIVGCRTRVVDAPGLSIDELAGNVSSREDRISIAHVVAKQGTSEPYLTLHYDEWICVVKGQIKFQTSTGDLIANAGDTVCIETGTRFQPLFLQDSEYIPVCLPAFRPDRCVREDGDSEEGKSISANLKQLHSGGKPSSSTTDNPSSGEEQPPEMLYHMTTKVEWQMAKTNNSAYFPKTFAQDGDYTHATGVPSRLVETANHFYQDLPGEWVCLQFRRSILRNQYGVVTRDEEAMPVGQKKISDDWTAPKRNWICPHVYGGIPIGCVEREYPMTRDGTKYTGIAGLV